MRTEGDRIVGRVFDVCIGALIAALALYGAVYVVSRVWVQLTIIALVIVVVSIIGWTAMCRFRRW